MDVVTPEITCINLSQILSVDKPFFTCPVKHSVQEYCAVVWVMTKVLIFLLWVSVYSLKTGSP